MYLIHSKDNFLKEKGHQWTAFQIKKKKQTKNDIRQKGKETGSIRE